MQTWVLKSMGLEISRCTNVLFADRCRVWYLTIRVSLADTASRALTGYLRKDIRRFPCRLVLQIRCGRVIFKPIVGIMCEDRSLAMTVTFQLPPEIEQQLRDVSPDLNAEAKEAFLVDLYRRRKLSHVALSQGLGLD